MTRILLRFLVLGAWLWPIATATAQSSSRVAVSLHANSSTPAPGKTTLLAIRFAPAPGWHGYWSNPGESGLPPKVTWDLPSGVRIGALQHPAPEVLSVAGMTSFVHGGQHALLARIQIPAGLAVGAALPIRGEVSFLICSDSLCVPQKAAIKLDLTVGDGRLDAGSGALFAAARTAMPKKLSEAGEFASKGRIVELTIPASANLDSARANFFPTSEGVFTRSSARRLDDGALLLTGSLSSVPANLAGIVSDGRRSVQLSFKRGKPPAVTPMEDVAASVPDPAGSAPTTSLAISSPAKVDAPTTSFPSSNPPPQLIWAILGALAGGLLLNLMPCVFPILSLKALHLARSGSSNSSARRDASAYTAGVLATCVALGSTLLALRGSGMAAGWSFQLQNPYVILGLLALVLAIALNLAGLFHISGPSFDHPVEDSRMAGSFGTGALSAFVATPCSAPFMASALGAALLLPPVEALLVFVALGIGLALPFLAIGWIPALRSQLPRPGAWMVTLQRILAVPMLVTALGLAWVLGRQVGIDGLLIGLAAVTILALGLWWVGLRQHAGKSRTWLPLAPAAALALGTASIVPAVASAPTTVVSHQTIEPFSETWLDELRKAGRPVFVDFTADWCLSCKVNEKVAIEREATQAAFARHGVVTLVGDWTRGDQAITNFLAKHGRNSIPFYLFYEPHRDVRILPQILTGEMLVSIAAGGRPEAAVQQRQRP
jgi:thiol:disulfide interchange protein/DsbC/DsbD-like thiol-disulfide interchange protein